jgi:hypothetical protein
MPACESVPLTAAPGTTMTLTANPEFVIANGGVSVVTAILVEPAGTFVPDGTEVFFFTNLGRVDASGKTRNGVARVNFVSDSRSGEATVTGFSGGQAPAPSPTATPASSLDGVTASAAGGGPAVAAAGASATTGENSAFVKITIGSALPELVVVTADPPILDNARSATIVANVFDLRGNPVQNVPVIFSVSGDPLQEVLDSGGSPRHTDSNGRAFDTLTTRAPRGTVQKKVTVTATTPNGKSGPVDVAVNYATGR